MKSINKFSAAVVIIIFIIFIIVNIFLSNLDESSGGRPYRVEIARIAKQIEQNGWETVDLSKYTYIIAVVQYNSASEEFFENTDSDFTIKMINGSLYRFDYKDISKTKQKNIVASINAILLFISFLILILLIFIRQKILKPFLILRDVPYELSKGNLIVPIKENKNRFFGRFVWGVDLLRENLEQQKKRELDLQREKKTLLLSISHDIKTPLSAIKLYSKALSKGLYQEMDKQTEIAESINAKADEIEEFVSQIIRASSEDFLNLEVMQGEFYLSELISTISIYYKDKLKLIKTSFSVDEYSDCILKGDINRSIEVLQNIIENAVKYGDGHKIVIEFSEEEDCQLVKVINSGCTLPETELAHIFESFWRGSNAGSSKGSGLGLYICRQLMRKMDGEIYAEIKRDLMCMTAVFRKAI